MARPIQILSAEQDGTDGLIELLGRDDGRLAFSAPEIDFALFLKDSHMLTCR
jgi:hypothetical protein